MCPDFHPSQTFKTLMKLSKSRKLLPQGHRTYPRQDCAFDPSRGKDTPVCLAERGHRFDGFRRVRIALLYGTSSTFTKRASSRTSNRLALGKVTFSSRSLSAFFGRSAIGGLPWQTGIVTDRYAFDPRWLDTWLDTGHYAAKTKQ